MKYEYHALTYTLCSSVQNMCFGSGVVDILSCVMNQAALTRNMTLKLAAILSKKNYKPHIVLFFQQNPHHHQAQILKVMPEVILQKRKSRLGQAERLPQTTRMTTGRNRSPKRQKLGEVLIVLGRGRRRKLIVNLKKV